MSCTVGAKVASTGLVFEYDMSNTQKSWKGAPSTNLLSYSDQFDSATWQKSGITVTPNAAIAPDGTLTADRILSTAWILQTPPGILSATTYTFSVYLKSATGVPQSVAIAIEDNGTPGVSTYPQCALTAEWQRFTVTLTSSAATSI
jgi:hypothetical protein